MQKKIDKIFKHLSLKHNIPVRDVKDAINSQFLFAKTIMEQGEHDNEDSFKTIKLLSFGKLVVPKNMIRHIINNKLKNGSRTESPSESRENEDGV
jgi:hypothetical protein